MLSVPLVVRDTAGIDRRAEPVSCGVPFPRGAVRDEKFLRLRDGDGKPLPLQVAALVRWPDGSLKWARIDFAATSTGKSEKRYELFSGQGQAALSGDQIVVRPSCRDIVVQSGICQYALSLGAPGFFSSITSGCRELLDPGATRLVITEDHGGEHVFVARSMEVESSGPVRATVRVTGSIGMNAPIDVIARLTFFAGTPAVRLDVTVRNPRAVSHPGGFWDLGDRNSVQFKNLLFDLCTVAKAGSPIGWTAEPGEKEARYSGQRLEIYQDSSGGRNWQSSNHVDRSGTVKNAFCGYRVYGDDKAIGEGLRASPCVSVTGVDCCVEGVIRGFWQNFPKSIAAGEGRIMFGLFPGRHEGLYELQPGEQKTHTLFFAVTDIPLQTGALGAMAHAPLEVSVTPEHCALCGVFPYLFRPGTGSAAGHEALIMSAIDGPRDLFSRREEIDEFGWRNFGDLYADHEKEHYAGQAPLISHYNNQYDVIEGAAIRFACTGDRRWFRLMDELARHVIDIDLYHTASDKPAYNGGLFWHTDHYKSALTATHRCYARKNGGGGGPSNEHNYTTGLMYYHCLTGDPQVKEAVVSLARWVIAMDDGRKSAFRFLDRGDTGLASCTVSRDYVGPGRGAGNSINALLDAFELTGDRAYLGYAEKLIRRSIHPKDDVAARRLDDPERRWSYTVFLKVLGKYLDLKRSIGEADLMFAYARKSLLAYAAWMRDNEYVYLDKPERLVYPTETWAAQELRKANVFLYAAKYGDAGVRSAFLERARYFWETGLSRLGSFATARCVRPLAIVLSCGTMYDYFAAFPDTVDRGEVPDLDPGLPERFVPQRTRVVRKVCVGAVVAAGLAVAAVIMIAGR